MLTGAARTAQIRAIGTVNAHFQPAYDILVRPAGVRSSLEQATGTVQPDFLSGIYGGITMAQWRQIKQIADVQVPAPIAMVGYDLVDAEFPVQIPAANLRQPGRQLYRATTTWVSQNGTTTIPQAPTYVYVTPNPAHPGQRQRRDHGDDAGRLAGNPVPGYRPVGQPVQPRRAGIFLVLVES